MENNIIPYQQNQHANAELLDEGEPITPGYLHEKGFIPWTESEHLYDFDYPFRPDLGELLFIQKECARQMFAVILRPEIYEDRQCHYGFDVIVRHNIGCGFVRIPNQFSYMPIKYFEMLYEAIRRERL